MFSCSLDRELAGAIYAVRFYDGARFIELNYNNPLSALRMRDLLRDDANIVDVCYRYEGLYGTPSEGM